MTVEGSEPPPYDWAVLVPRVVHPIRVAIIEAMRWSGQPLSATDMRRILEGEDFTVSQLSYHFNVLAERKVGVIEIVRRRRVRGSEEKFYYLRDTQAR